MAEHGITAWPARVERSVTDRVLPPHLDWPVLALAGGTALAATLAGVLGAVGWAGREEAAALVCASVVLALVGLAGLALAVLAGLREARRHYRYGH